MRPAEHPAFDGGLEVGRVVLGVVSVALVVAHAMRRGSDDADGRYHAPRPPAGAESWGSRLFVSPTYGLPGGRTSRQPRVSQTCCRVAAIVHCASGPATVTVSGASTTYTVSTTDDDVDEPAVTVTVTLTAGEGYTVAAAPGDAAQVTVADNDVSALPALYVDDLTARGGDLRRRDHAPRRGGVRRAGGVRRNAPSLPLRGPEAAEGALRGMSPGTGIR